MMKIFLSIGTNEYINVYLSCLSTVSAITAMRLGRYTKGTSRTTSTEAKGTSLCNQVLPYNFLCYLPLLALTGYGDVKRFEPSTDTDLVS